MADEEFENVNPEDRPQDSDDDNLAGAVETEDLTADEPDGTDPSAMNAEIKLPPLALTLESATEEHQAPALDYPVVGFGASAGGLQAFKVILENLDPNTGMSFVLVTHMAPDQKSFLAEILERYTQMPVVSVEDGQRPEPNHLYVLKPNQALTLHEGAFHVEHPQFHERIPKTIDKFFHSLASDQKNHAIGVVLSGADSDGALGLKTIKGEGGIALVQSPDTAVHSDMPRSSIASDHVDFVIPPAEIAIELGRLGRQFARPEVRSLEEGVISPDDEQSFHKILQMLRADSGLDLRLYKPETVRRRLARRMLLRRMDHLSHYLQFLQARNDELQKLQEDVLINVTRFFRDPAFWESLRANVLPSLLQDRTAEKPIRVWCAGCSTGEEAYSLAIVLLEHLSQHGLDAPVQIFGTDVSEQSIETARIAVYPETIIGDISPERLRRYFVKVDRGFQVSKRVRDSCVFARQNLAGDPPFSHIDLLACRNVMIYFTQALQRQVMVTFHYALEPGGYILLGMSEGLRDYGDIFSPVDRKHKIYMKTGASLPFPYEAPHSFGLPRNIGTGLNPMVPVENAVWPELELQRAADRIVISRFGPPGLIVDERMNVLQSRGQTAPYLDITPGAVNWNLLRILRDGLANEVRNAMQRAIVEDVSITTAAAVNDEETGEHNVRIDVLPIAGPPALPRCFLVLFRDLDKEADGSFADQPALPHLTQDEKDRLIAQFRNDLTSTRLHLQSLVEERDARNQELVSANEEIQSANEELQSTNEELETTKEELQSANEELQTVNDELQQRNNILSQTGNDLTNLLNSVNIPLLMLSSDLRIRQFTPPMQRLLSVRQADIGRSISEIRLQLSIENIKPILTDVLETLGTREIEVQDRDGRWNLLRVRPYRTAENKIEGLVMILVDIDQLRRSQQNLMEAHNFASSVVETVTVPIVVLNQDLTIRAVNTAFRGLTEMQTKELEGRSLPDLAGHLWGVEGIQKKLEGLLGAQNGSLVEFEHESITSLRKTLLIKALPVSTERNRALLLVIEDITLRREAERLVARQTAQLEDEIEIAVRKLDRTQGELHGLTGHLFTVQEQERQRVARELHDDISQRLSLLEIALQELSGASSGDGHRERTQSALEQVRSLNEGVRQISHRLHPAILNDLGLSTALKTLASEFGEREKMPVTYSTHDLPENWSQLAATCIYRIAQEALRNVAKHAGKTHVKLTLSGAGDRLELKVMDFGLGFDQEAENPVMGLGLISMQERARLAGGTVSVQSALGHGTTITVDIPAQHPG